MNRTQLAQALAGGYKSREYNAIVLMLNKISDEQLKEFISIYNKVMEVRNV